MMHEYRNEAAKMAAFELVLQVCDLYIIMHEYLNEAAKMVAHKVVLCLSSQHYNA